MTLQEYLNQPSPKRCEPGEVEVKRSECKIFENSVGQLVVMNFGRLGKQIYTCKSDDDMKLLYTPDDFGYPDKVTSFRLIED